MEPHINNEAIDQKADSDAIAERDSLEEYKERLAARKQKQRKLRRRLISLGVVIVLIAGGTYAAWSLLGSARRPRINLTVRQSPEKTESQQAGAPATPDNIADQAVVEALGAIRTTQPNNPQTAGTGSTNNASQLPLHGKAGPDPNSNGELTENQKADVEVSDNGFQPQPFVSRRNQERSIRFTDESDSKSPTITATRLRPNKETSPASTESTAQIKPTPASIQASARESSLPAFGSLLPVRTLGTVYTLRSGSLTRLELTRDVTRDGWSLQRGTVLLANLNGSAEDRAFMSLVGFIDSVTGRLVKLSGDVLGADGGAGIKGKRHKLSNAWSRALARIGSSAINVAGAIGAGRISGQPVIITDLGSRTVNPVTSELDGVFLDQSRSRGFVEVPAGTTGFVLITQLPQSSTVNSTDHIRSLTDAEVAEILTSGDPTLIQANLPRMSPDMQRLARAALTQPEK